MSDPLKRFEGEVFAAMLLEKYQVKLPNLINVAEMLMPSFINNVRNSGRRGAESATSLADTLGIDIAVSIPSEYKKGYWKQILTGGFSTPTVKITNLRDIKMVRKGNLRYAIDFTLTSKYYVEEKIRKKNGNRALYDYYNLKPCVIQLLQVESESLRFDSEEGLKAAEKWLVDIIRNEVVNTRYDVLYRPSTADTLSEVS